MAAKTAAINASGHTKTSTTRFDIHLIAYNFIEIVMSYRRFFIR